MTTAQLTELTEHKTDKTKQVIALYNGDDRLVGIVNGWRVADGVMEMDGTIKRAVLTAELSPLELYEIDNQIARLRDLRGTL
jgi:hypothetical protein